jgi:3-isopropylmalate dehydrogenase
VDKANVFRSFALFRKVFFDVAQDFGDIHAEATYVDAMSLYMVQQPSAYDVVVTENQFGDILSDLGAALVGGLGLAPSAEIGDRHGLFQPSHGSAPQLAGKDLANPLAMILSAAMMLTWLGHRHADPSATEAGDSIQRAVQATLRAGAAIPQDLGGTDGTQAVAQAVARAVEPTS